MLDETTGWDYGAEQRTMCPPVSILAHRSCGRLRWHCVQAKPGQTFQAELALTSQGWSVYHPLHLHRVTGHPSRIVSLFNPYLFVAFDPEADQWPLICRCFGVAALLGPPGMPAAVPHGVVEELQRRTSDRRIVDDPLSPEAWRSIPPGAAVSVAEGPLASLRGIVALSAKDRCRVLLSLMGREVAMDIPTRDLARLPEGSGPAVQAGMEWAGEVVA